MLQNTTTDKYIKAFIKVAEMLEPTANFNSYVTEIKLTDGGYEKKLSVNGKINDNVLVYVTTQKNVTEGLQLVVNYVDLENGTTKQRSYWYFSFNWKGLSETADQ